MLASGTQMLFLPRDAELPVVRGQRNHLCDLLGVPRPQLATKVTSILRIYGACAVCCSELLSKVNRVPQLVLLSSLPGCTSYWGLCFSEDTCPCLPGLLSHWGLSSLDCLCLAVEAAVGC